MGVSDCPEELSTAKKSLNRGPWLWEETAACAKLCLHTLPSIRSTPPPRLLAPTTTTNGNSSPHPYVSWEETETLGYFPRATQQQAWDWALPGSKACALNYFSELHGKNTAQSSRSSALPQVNWVTWARCSLPSLSFPTCNKGMISKGLLALMCPDSNELA